jgi:hypothetical protein
MLQAEAAARHFYDERRGIAASAIFQIYFSFRYAIAALSDFFQMMLL